MLIEGVFAAVTTPFYPDERVYYRKLEANVARYSRSQLAGMVVLGSTGEAPALNDEETSDVLRTAAEAAAPEKVLIAGVNRESLRAVIELAEAAAKFQYDAVLVRTPTYYSTQMTPSVVAQLFPGGCRSFAASGGPLQHSAMRAVSDSGGDGGRARASSQHYRDQGFKREPRPDQGDRGIHERSNETDGDGDAGI